MEVKIVPSERISAKICEQIVGASVPQAVDELVSSFQEETVEVIKLFPEERTPRRIVQGFTLKERISERKHEQTVDQSGDQARRDTAESVRRQSCRHASGGAATGPSNSDGIEIYGSPDQPGDQARRFPRDSVHRQGCCRYACGVAGTGPSDSDCVEDSGKPDCAQFIDRDVEAPLHCFRRKLLGWSSSLRVRLMRSQMKALLRVRGSLPLKQRS